MKYSGTQELEVLESGAPNYNHFLVTKFRKELSRYGLCAESRILDFGAGIGTLADLWRGVYETEISCLEIDNGQRKVLLKKGFKVLPDLPSAQNQFNIVYLSNVLEHIDDDVSVLKSIGQDALGVNGLVLVYVPAFQFLYSPLDEKLKHYRRYSRESLKSALEGADFSVLHVEFVDCLGIVGWLAQKYLSKITRKPSPNPRLVVIYDKFLFPISVFLDRIVMSRIAGKNLLIVGQKLELNSICQ